MQLDDPKVLAAVHKMLDSIPQEDAFVQTYVVKLGPITVKTIAEASYTMSVEQVADAMTVLNAGGWVDEHPTGWSLGPSVRDWLWKELTE